MSDNKAFRSWQRIDHHAPRQYYDRMAAGSPPGHRNETGADRGVLGRALLAAGAAVGLAGFAGAMWLILSFIEALDPNSAATNPFTAPTVLGVVAALVGGGVVAAIGSSMARRGP
jgi:hypothetical protein